MQYEVEKMNRYSFKTSALDEVERFMHLLQISVGQGAE
jgi:hypothetical protein